ncbi:MAG: N-acetyltransferase family protein [Alphaproteobacteria bacterium]|nr:N-acetyltransferase family protein [Alphaproteobacteria bacterium]
MRIRDATHSDLPQMLAIFNDVIATSTAVYALAPVSLEDRTQWMQARQAQGFPILAAVDGDDLLGFASYGEWRGAWGGYKFTVEHSVHVKAGLRGTGIGRQLMEHLILAAHTAGLHVMIGAIDADNAASIRFHERLGFTAVAHFHEVGFKFNRWLDVVFMQRVIGPPQAAP